MGQEYSKLLEKRLQRLSRWRRNWFLNQLQLYPPSRDSEFQQVQHKKNFKEAVFGGKDSSQPIIINDNGFKTSNIVWLQPAPAPRVEGGNVVFQVDESEYQ